MSYTKTTNASFLSFGLLFLALYSAHIASPICRAQDKRKPSNLNLPRIGARDKSENIIYPSGAEAVIDVTKAPYYADNTGAKDCTAALNRAYDDVMKKILDALSETVELKKRNPNLKLSREGTGKVVLFPRVPTTSDILYFPNGTYTVSDTILYSFENLRNTLNNELSRQIHFQGQSQAGTIIKLRDNAKGFVAGAQKPVISFMRGAQSNVAMSNTFENITINTGAGNHGAIGLMFHASNTGAVRNVTIKSGDPDRVGYVGLGIMKNKPMGYIKHVTIEGFDYGIWVSDYMLCTVYEHITLMKQKIAGFRIVDNPVSVRKVKSDNAVPAFQVVGARGHLVLTDGELNGGTKATPAIDLQNGFLFARNVTTSGYGHALKRAGAVDVHQGRSIAEYSSHGAQSLFGPQKSTSLNLPVEETPRVPWEQDLTQWASVNDYGAKGDGHTDDTRAIQAAMNSGKSTVYFQPGRYLIDNTVSIPPSVRRVNFMYVDLVAGERLKRMKDKGAFKVVGNSTGPLIIEDLFAWEEFFGDFYLVDHASRRTLVMSDIHLQAAAAYRNSVSGGKIYLENICTVDDEGEGNGFTFTGQKVWARQLDAERANPQVLNNHSALWVLGFKTESTGVAFETKYRGKTEVLGGVINNYSPLVPPGRAAIINNESDVTFISTTNGRSDAGHYFQDMVKETRNGVTKKLNWRDVPRRYDNQSVVPLYVGYR